jgi:O-acetylserine/cysteine efflux transporter
MLIAATLLVPVAMLVEGPPKHITLKGAATLAYVAPIATAFAYWAVVEAGRRFPASTIAMALLATPGVGLMISALSLGEALDASLLAGTRPDRGRHPPGYYDNTVDKQGSGVPGAGS